MKGIVAVSSWRNFDKQRKKIEGAFELRRGLFESPKLSDESRIHNYRGLYSVLWLRGESIQQFISMDICERVLRSFSADAVWLFDVDYTTRSNAIYPRQFKKLGLPIPPREWVQILDGPSMISISKHARPGRWVHGHIERPYLEFISPSFAMTPEFVELVGCKWDEFSSLDWLDCNVKDGLHLGNGTEVFTKEHDEVRQDVIRNLMYSEPHNARLSWRTLDQEEYQSWLDLEMPPHF